MGSRVSTPYEDLPSQAETDEQTYVDGLLKLMRGVAAQAAGGVLDPSRSALLLDTFTQLDLHLSRGNRLPRDWDSAIGALYQLTRPHGRQVEDTAPL